MKRIIALILTAVLALSLSTVAFATGSNSSSGSGYIISSDTDSKKVTTQTLSDGTKVVTTEYPADKDGIKIKTTETTTKEGETTLKADVIVPETLGTATVTIPMEEVGNTTVVAIINEDGTKTIVKLCAATEDGIVFNAKGTEKYEIFDNEVEFTDELSANTKWAAEEIEFVAAREIFVGYEDKSFKADNNMTRAELITVLSRIADQNVVTTGADWYKAPVAWAKAAGITDGTDLDEDITREQMVTMLWRYYGEPAVTVSLEKFSDAADIHDWATGAVQWAVSVGIMQGDGNGLNPQGNASRAELSALVARFIKASLK